ncbi:Ras-specific guanine nucleotide-releasing factor RalGPS2 [Papilio xuthus]|uniref:Ras-specific guanine nucleotide-releasing factor RalGPS2 n=1 Tax=Papilio xuthus TaxID=66420 RepID=A0A194PTJ1_PAPXU|nr:Ras-specific guanine nucleotide-releasing factor RalGPS2 [Papilio xuthus]
MPRDILSESLAVLRIIEHEDEESWPLEDKAPACKQANKKIVNPAPSSQKVITKDDSACYFNFAHGDGTSNRQQDPIYQYKTNSLPAASSINQSWDEIVCSALRISPEDIANQLSLLDLACFKAIQAEELTTCGWNKRNKLTVAPNVVAFTKRFNRVSFWTVQEILNGQSPKARAETLTHFIKVAKKLHELNNLHSLFAIISALNSASIYRLTKTWACLSKKDKQQFDKMAELFGEKDNWSALREYLRTISLPCIPYLGIFLTDLVYIDMAHPAESPHRAAKMAVVLRALRRYQASQYEVPPLPHVAAYLNSVRYIEELQKFLEDDQYKLSVKLEPPSPTGSRTGSKESVKECAASCTVAGSATAATSAGGCAGAPPSLSVKLEPPSPTGSRTGSKESVKECAASCTVAGSATAATSAGGCAGAPPSSLSPSHRIGCGSLRLQAPFQPKFIPTHRKCRSLGSNIFGKGAGQGEEREGCAGPTPPGSVNLLDDTLLDAPVAAAPAPPGALHSELSNSAPLQCDFQSYVRRKTVLKDGRKISLSSWQRFWLELAGSALVFYASKSFKGSNRNDFRSERCKVVPLAGWAAALEPPDCFQLLHHAAGTLYRFKTGSESVAKQWVEKIEEVNNRSEKPLPANLMSFE